MTNQRSPPLVLQVFAFGDSIVTLHNSSELGSALAPALVSPKIVGEYDGSKD